MITAWLRAPGHEHASVRTLEPAAFDGDDDVRRVVARDGETTLDAWIGLRSGPEPGVMGPDAGAYWRVASILSAVVRGSVEVLLRADTPTPPLSWSAWVIEGRAMLCRDPDGGCCSLPDGERPQSLSCFDRDGTCRLETASAGGRSSEWILDPSPRGVRARRTRSGPAVPARLEGRSFAALPVERGPWQALPVEPTRPSIVDDAALAPPSSAEREAIGFESTRSACEPTVRSFANEHLMVRSVGCGEGDPMDVEDWPVAFVITQSEMHVTPLFVARLGPPWPLREHALGDLAPGAIGFVASSSDGGSPGGSTSDDLWVFLPATSARGARLHRLEIESGGSMGLGNQDEREGYVVGVDLMRASFEVVGPGAGHFVSCESWSGTHARRSDRWSGVHREAPLDLRVTFDADRGFEMSDADRAALSAGCRPEAP